mgnify:CR=1 FL=1
MVNVKPVQLGKNTRMSFSHINEVLDMPNLIEIQKNSYDWFLKEGLREVFDDVSGITDFNGNLVLDFVNYKLDEKPNYTVTECKERDATYAAALRVTARLLNKETGEIKESEVFMGDFPLMTPSGTFVINGAERVIVSQLVRSPGVYYKMEYDKTGKQLFSSTVIPNRGAWLEYENDVNDVLYVRIDKNRKLPMTAFIRALGLGTDEEIKEYFGEDERILATIDKDTTHTMEEGLFEVYRKLRPSEPPTVESAQFHLNGLFFDPRRYDLSRVGRYKYNKKLNLAGRITGRQLSRPIVNPATGEVMAIGVNVEQALMKAVRGAEIGCDTLRMKSMANLTVDELLELIGKCTDQRMFAMYEAIARGVTLEKLHEITKIDYFFLHKYLNLYNMECRLKEGNIDAETYLRAKKMGYPDKAIERLSGEKVPMHRDPVYKMVDTCAAEFAAETPYFYATYDDENEAKEFLDERPKKPCVVVLGSGPIRIGQGIEFDYASVHCVWMLKQAGYDVVMINNNPETVSTDFDTADRLYFEPLTAEDVLGVIATEKPVGVVAAFGGQTAIKLTHALEQAGVRIMGTSADMIDAAEDRERFDAAMEKYGIKRAKGRTVMTSEEAVAAANELGYPVLVRPSYVLGGQNMIIAYQDSDIIEYMRIILAQGIENPVLIDQYLMGIEAEADAICDGTDVLIPGIMEHVERSGIHSGDSIAVYPAWNLTGAMTQRLIEVTRQIALELGTLGLINIQYIVYHNEVYVIEANPRASRTVPYISKVTGVPMVDLAVRAMLGEKIRDMGYGTGLYRQSPYYAVKVPCFSFEKLADVDTHLGPEMKSTGEVLGIGTNLQEAIFKGLVAAGYKMRHQGGILVSVRDKDKPEAIDCARKFAKLGFNIFATPGTARAMQEHGLYAAVVKKEAQEKMLEMGQVQYVISTSNKGRLPQLESVRMRRKAVERGIPLFTSLDTANALANALTSRYSLGNVELVDINNMRTKHKKLTFTKMRGTGNDYLYFDCFDQTVESPESLAVRLSNRRTGVGSDGIVLIMPSTIADAKMRMFNADGTEGSVAGNALRCVCKYLYENGHVRKDEMTVETGSGVKTAKLFIREDQVFSVLVDMGCPAFAPAKIPVKLDGDRVMMRPVFLAGEKREISCVSMGNPHVVIFVEDVNRIPLEQVGPQIETDSLFPERVNVSFAQIVDKNDIVMRVWERGIGETAACGTGACAVAVAAVENGFCTRGADIDVRLPGGTLVVRYQEDGKVWLTGDANTDFTGTIEI